jgi:hypothetical protein
VSPKTANKRNTIIEDASDSSSAATCAEDSMQSTATLIPIDAPESHFNAEQPSALTVVEDPAGPRPGVDSSIDGLLDDRAASDAHSTAVDDSDVSAASNNRAQDALVASTEPSDAEVAVTSSDAVDGSGTADTSDDHLVALDAPGAMSEPGDLPAVDAYNDATEVMADQTDSSDTATEAPASSLPDPSDISARLKNLVVAVSQVEELSRQARERAGSDLALFDGIADSQRQFEDGLAEAQRIGQEAQAVYQRAFGREAKALAEPAVTEAREVQQAFEELAGAWRQQAQTFLAEHPDVETLLAEQRQHSDETRRRESARAKAERFQELVTSTDAALRQGLLDEARDCLKMLGHEFPAEAARVAPLQERLDHRVRAANDAAARRVMLQASEFQGRGEFDSAVRLLEAVEVNGLSRETSEDVFGRWSAACSLLGQTGELELLRSSSNQGRGIILHRDPSVPYGLVVFSALGMGPAYFQGRIVSAADREGAAIIGRARTFREAELPPEFNTGWYGPSYATSGASGAPVRH